MIRRIVIVLALTGSVFGATARPMSTARVDVFETFRLLDEQLSKLDGNYRDFQQALDSPSSQKQARKAWRRELRVMRISSSKIGRLSRRMYSQYHRPSRELRYRMFANWINEPAY
jgi:hypothetical protein